MTPAQLKLVALRAWLQGMWDSPALTACGPVYADPRAQIRAILDASLTDKEVTDVDAIMTAEGYHVLIHPREQAVKEIAQHLDAEAAKQLLNRIQKQEGSHVLWDPDDDGDGYLLVGDDPAALARQAARENDWV